MQTATDTGQRFVRAENPHRHDWSERLRNQKTDSGQGRLQIAIHCACAFWKNQRPVPGLQDSNQRFKRAAVDCFLIDWNDIEFRQQPAQQRNFEQGFLREKIDGAIARVPRQWWIKITLVIHGENHRTSLNHALPVDDAEAKEQPGKQAAKMVTEPIVRIHLLNR